MGALLLRGTSVPQRHGPPSGCELPSPGHRARMAAVAVEEPVPGRLSLLVWSRMLFEDTTDEVCFPLRVRLTVGGVLRGQCPLQVRVAM